MARLFKKPNPFLKRISLAKSSELHSKPDLLVNLSNNP
jgi:hypothetical protein